jgi:hypothetical protein
MSIDLIELARKSGVQGLDESKLTGQSEAYKICCEFLKKVEKRQTINRKHGSYGLKHMVENPAGRFGVPSSPSLHQGYIYEGTFILAAISQGFRWVQPGKHLKVNFNISERSLKSAVRSAAGL